MVVSVDGFYWYDAVRTEDCEKAKETAARLFKARDGRPMILATVPGEHCINATLREQCKDACVLFEPPPFWGLHPDADYMDNAAAVILKRISNTAEVSK